MTPIINPWSIYWINVLSMANEIAQVVALLSFISIILLGLVFLFAYYLDETERKIINRLFVIACIILGVSFLTFTFVPDKETMYTMFFLKYVTPDNINIGAEGLKSMFDYIVEAVSKLMEG